MGKKNHYTILNGAKYTSWKCRGVCLLRVGALFKQIWYMVCGACVCVCVSLIAHLNQMSVLRKTWDITGPTNYLMPLSFSHQNFLVFVGCIPQKFKIMKNKYQGIWLKIKKSKPTKISAYTVLLKPDSKLRGERQISKDKQMHSQTFCKDDDWECSDIWIGLSWK